MPARVAIGQCKMLCNKSMILWHRCSSSFCKLCVMVHPRSVFCACGWGKQWLVFASCLQKDARHG